MGRWCAVRRSGSVVPPFAYALPGIGDIQVDGEGRAVVSLEWPEELPPDAWACSVALFGPDSHTTSQGIVLLEPPGTDAQMNVVPAGLHDYYVQLQYVNEDEVPFGPLQELGPFELEGL